MANHRDTHPTDVDGCFGCKALGVGYQGLQSRQGADPVQVVPVRGDVDGRRVGEQHEHWDGRRDATVTAPSVLVKMKTQEIQG